MVFSTNHLQDLQRLMKVLEAFREKLASVIVKCQVGVVISNVRMVITVQFFRNNDCLGLKFNSLKIVPKLKLNIGHFANTRGNIRVHWSSDLQKDIDSLTV